MRLLPGLLILLSATAIAQDEPRDALRAAAIRYLATHYLDTVPRGATCVSIDGATPTDAELATLRKVRPIDPPTECTCRLKDDDDNCLRGPPIVTECRVEIGRFTIESATRATVDASYVCGPLHGRGETAQFVRIADEWIYESSPQGYVN